MNLTVDAVEGLELDGTDEWLSRGPTDLHDLHIRAGVVELNPISTMPEGPTHRLFDVARFRRDEFHFRHCERRSKSVWRSSRLVKPPGTH